MQQVLDFGSHETLDRDAEAARVLVTALAATQAGVCLCDEHDLVRYANPTFRDAFFPDLPGQPTHFVHAIAMAIASSRGIKLESMPLDEFIPRVIDRRRNGAPAYDFTVDLADGRWWQVNDRRLDNGWILVIATDISHLKREEFALRDAHANALQASQTDFLTRLYSRRHGITCAENALQEFRTNHLPLTLAILDIDHFKEINDAYGHEAGDQVLVQFARALKAQLAARDHIARMGGEEFMVVMPATPLSRGKARLDRMLRKIPPVDWGSRASLAFTFSAGVVAAHYSDELAALLARADMALYRAKAGGRARVEVGRPSLSEHSKLKSA